VVDGAPAPAGLELTSQLARSAVGRSHGGRQERASDFFFHRRAQPELRGLAVAKLRSGRRRRRRGGRGRLVRGERLLRDPASVWLAKEGGVGLARRRFPAELATLAEEEELASDGHAGGDGGAGGGEGFGLVSPTERGGGGSSRWA